MPPKRNPKQHRKSHEKERAINSAMSNCVFPLDIMICILKRLPVRSILRFKSVCKPLCTLFSTPKFIKMQYDQFSDDKKNQYFLIYSLSMYYDHTMSLLNTLSDQKKLTNLDHPYPEIFFRMDFVGCCNGLVCMGCPPLGQAIALWNPIMKMWKFIRLSKKDFGVPEQVSLGFGYDAEKDDFNVVRVVCLADKEKDEMRVGVEVYSANSDSCETVKVGFRFHVLTTKNDTIVNGKPYWIAKVGKNQNNVESYDGGVIMCLDVARKVFDVLPIPIVRLESGSQAHLVNWKGSLAFAVCRKNKDRVKSVEIYVFDEGEKIWSKKHSFGPIEIGVGKFLQCSKRGIFLGELIDGKLFLYDPERNVVDMEIEADEFQPRSYVGFEYTESLACIKGMEKVVVKKEEEENEQRDDDEEDDDPTSVEVEVEGLSSFLQMMVTNRPLRGVIN